jgi:hypothetical protein
VRPGVETLQARCSSCPRDSPTSMMPTNVLSLPFFLETPEEEAPSKNSRR